MLFPALGIPTSPTSAINFSSNVIHNSSPGRPRSAIFGAWLVELLKAVLPRPPLPPRATTACCPASVRSAKSWPVSVWRATAPGGTTTITSLPPAPAIFLPPPCAPRPALKWLRFLKWTRVLSCESTSRITSPPLPPCPPAGPPRGTNFSRRKATAPSPPWPAFTKILASSKNN